MDKLESTVLRREEAITNVTEDLVKANQIIAKLHADNKSAAKVVALSLLILTNRGVCPEPWCTSFFWVFAV